MAQATSTQLGEIKLAGDLAGSNNALIPELSTSGVTAGQYIMPTLTVDAKGRITSATATTGSVIVSMLPNSTTSTKGVVQVGSGLNVASGIVNADIGSTVQKGILQVGSGLSVSSGIVAIDWTAAPTATGSTLGFVKVGSGLTVSSGVISLDTSGLPVASATVSGTIKVGSGLSISAGVLSAAANPDATYASKGVVQIASGEGLSVTSGILSAVQGSTSVKGYLQVGDGLSATSGTVSLNRTSYASSGTAGLIKVGNGLQIDGAGVLNVNQATLPDATTSTKGLVTVDPAGGINLNSGVISIDPLPVATASTLGAVKPGTNMSVNLAGALSVSVADATNASKGIVQVNTTNTGLTINSGVLGMQYASSTGWGSVKVGSNISVDGTGVISIPVATASVFGVVKGDGSTVTVSNGIISANATLPDATTSTKGIVQIGTGLSVTNGLVSVATASGSTTYGMVKGDGSTVNITNGVISVNTSAFVMKDTYTLTTKNVHVTPKVFTTATSNTNYNLDLQTSNCFTVTAQGSSVALGFFAPTNAVVGMTFHIILTQGSTPTTVQPSFNGVFVFPSAYTMASGALYGDMLECTVVSASKIVTKVIAANQYGIGL